LTILTGGGRFNHFDHFDHFKKSLFFKGSNGRMVCDGFLIGFLVCIM